MSDPELPQEPITGFNEIASSLEAILPLVEIAETTVVSIEANGVDAASQEWVNQLCDSSERVSDALSALEGLFRRINGLPVYIEESQPNLITNSGTGELTAESHAGPMPRQSELISGYTITPEFFDGFLRTHSSFNMRALLWAAFGVTDIPRDSFSRIRIQIQGFMDEGIMVYSREERTFYSRLPQERTKEIVEIRGSESGENGGKSRPINAGLDQMIEEIGKGSSPGKKPPDRGRHLKGKRRKK